ncbi:hypothetical protein B566_EDAN007135 [Ephemera danica]|nr:hypothetical protein B566_EDAN007135 [Ephemera danica]
MGTIRMMGPFLTWIVFIHFIFEISGSTHWVVTENGRIQAQEDSAFDIRRPDDFMAFLAQEDRVETLDKLTTELADRKDAMAARWAGLETHSELEGRLRVQDDDCVNGIPLTECNLYASTIIALVESERPILENSTSSNKAVPECLPLEFSLHLFEHLQAMRFRVNLSIEPELKLSQPNMTLWGRHIAASLNKNQSSWQLFNLATEFWRAKGDAPRAIECVRWALHMSPAPVRHIALVHLGNILHQARRSAEAAIVLHAAIDHAPRDAISHWTLGNVYTVLGDYTRAVACLDNAIQLDPSLEEVKITKHSVLCHSKVGQALSELKDTLQGLLHDLEHCQDMRQQRLRLQQMILREKTYPFNVMLGEHVRAELDASMQRLDNSLQHLLGAVQSMVQQLNVPKNKQADESSHSSDLSSQSTMEWPSTEECQTLARHSVNVALLFIPPENKGYEAKRYLGEMIGLAYTNHQLPWHPPLCMETSGEPTLSPVVLVKLRQFLPPSKPMKVQPEPDLMQQLLGYVGRESGMEEELGQRILTALNKGVGPKWLLLALAGLYWRAQGQLQPATQCLMQSLQLAPVHLSDLPLVALSSLLASQGHNSEATILALQALKQNNLEVTTNLLMASLLFSEGNYSGAKLHMLQAMKGRPDTHLASLTAKLACQIQLSDNQKPAEVCKQESSGQCRAAPSSSPAIHCMQTSDGDDDVEGLQSEMSRLLALALGEHQEEGSGDEGELLLAGPELESLEWHLRMEKDPGASKTSNYLSLVSSDSEAGELSWSLSREECRQSNQHEDWSRYMIGVSTREIELSSQLPPLPPSGEDYPEPACIEDVPHPVLDKLEGVRKRHQLPAFPEPGLGHGLRLLAAAGSGQTVRDVGSRIALALNKNSTSWVLATAAALYWRVVGQAGSAVTCLRQALRHAPQDVRDIPLLSLANVLHRAGRLDDAAVVAKMALEAAPKFVVTHFTLANILASKGELGKAMVFYQSSLGVQPNFEPARHRLKAILCSLLYPDENINLSIMP